MVRPLYRYILMAAFRDRFLYALAGIIVLISSLSVFFGSSALTEQDQFLRSFAAFGFRLFGVAGLVLFIINYIRRAFEGRDIEYLLSRPMGRVQFVLTHVAAFSTLAAFSAFLFGAIIMLMEIGRLGPPDFLWWASLAVEFIIMANVAMFFALVMRSATACMMVVFAFYMLARLMGEILGILHQTADSGMMGGLAKAMEVISFFIPRLDLMAQSKWLLYGVQPEISLPFVIGQGVIFCVMVVCAAVFDMRRRQF